MQNNARFFNAKKPNAEVDRSWGIARKVPVCPNCDSYLTPMLFIGGDGDKFDGDMEGRVNGSLHQRI